MIVVGGDISFASDPQEFEFATSWLTELCEAYGGSLDTVSCAPESRRGPHAGEQHAGVTAAKGDQGKPMI